MSPAYSIRVLESVREVPPERWDALIGDDSSPFVEHAWLEALETTGCVGGRTGWLPRHLSLWRGADLVAAAPSYAKQHSEGEFVFDWGWAEFAERIGIHYYPKLVIAVPFTPATGDRVLVSRGEDRDAVVAVFADAARQLCERLGTSGAHVLFPRESEAAAWQASGYLLRDGFQFHWHRQGAATFDHYLGRFSSKQRNQVRRELRHVSDAGIVVEALPPEGHTPAVAHTMHGFYASTIGKHGVWGRLYLNEAFFQRVVERFRDRLAWVVARDTATGELVGGAFNVVKRNRLYGRYWGTNSNVPFLHFVVCYYAGIRICLERGLDVFEPGAGGEHKRVRGFAPTLTRSAHWLADGRLRSALSPWLERERDRVRSIIAGAELTEP
ncbi:MAG: GNAT family N-acetyltransferase [Polyangiaceae bacterium]